MCQKTSRNTGLNPYRQSSGLLCIFVHVCNPLGTFWCQKNTWVLSGILDFSIAHLLHSYFESRLPRRLLCCVYTYSPKSHTATDVLYHKISRVHEHSSTSTSMISRFFRIFCSVLTKGFRGILQIFHLVRKHKRGFAAAGCRPPWLRPCP